MSEPTYRIKPLEWTKPVSDHGGLMSTGAETFDGKITIYFPNDYAPRYTLVPRTRKGPHVDCDSLSEAKRAAWDWHVSMIAKFLDPA